MERNRGGGTERAETERETAKLRLFRVVAERAERLRLELRCEWGSPWVDVADSSRPTRLAPRTKTLPLTLSSGDRRKLLWIDEDELFAIEEGAGSAETLEVWARRIDDAVRALVEAGEPKGI
jgi:hypothetical protein